MTRRLWRCWARCSAAAGPSTLLSIARVLVRHLPLVLMLVAMGVLFWPGSAEENRSGTLQKAA